MKRVSWTYSMGASETATMQQWINLRAEKVKKVALNKQPI